MGIKSNKKNTLSLFLTLRYIINELIKFEVEEEYITPPRNREVVFI